MSNIEDKLRFMPVEMLVGLTSDDSDRRAVEAMAHSVNGQQVADRLSAVEVDHNAEWQRQAQTLADICVPLLSTSRRPISRQEYIETLPAFVEQFPEELQALLPVDLIVETRIPWPIFAQGAGIDIDNYLRLRIEQSKDCESDPKKFKTPKKPYSTRVQDGTRLIYLKPSDARAQIRHDERGGTLYDAISLVALRPDIAKGKRWDLIGSAVGSDDVPFLGWFYDRPGLNARWDGNADPVFRALVCGRKIRT